MATILPFPAVSPRDGARVAASEPVPSSGVAAPFVEWLDPERLRAIHDERIDMSEWLRSRAVPSEHQTYLDFRLWHLLDDPALGGKIGIAVMLLVAVGLGALLAGARL